MEVYLKHFGAVNGVTGSCTLLTVKDKKDEKNILVDNGMYQEDKNEYRNFILPAGLIPSELDAACITHVHADHIGLLPALVENGFEGNIYMPKESLTLAKIQLESCAAIMEKQQLGRKQLKKLRRKTDRRYEKENRKYYGKKDIRREKAEEYIKKKRKREKEKLKTIDKINDTLNYGMDIEKAPYSLENIDSTLQMCREAPFNCIQELFPNIRVVNVFNSHIYGSGTWYFEIEDLDKNKSIYVVFSGDIGRDDNILYNPKKNINCNKEVTIVMESTYGDRLHTQTMEEAAEELLLEAVNAIKSGKKVVIPAFCLDRTQLLLHILNRAKNREDEIGKILRETDIIIDSNASVDYTEAYSSDYRNKIFKEQAHNYFSMSNIIKARRYTDHTEIIESQKPAIILTASGMGDHARAREYLERFIDNPKYLFIFPGFLSEPSFGHKVVSAVQNSRLKIGNGEKLKRARVLQIKGFSSHADQTELLNWLDSFKKKKSVILIHGDEEAKKALKSKIKDNVSVMIPKEGTTYEISADVVRDRE